MKLYTINNLFGVIVAVVFGLNNVKGYGHGTLTAGLGVAGVDKAAETHKIETPGILAIDGGINAGADLHLNKEGFTKNVDGLKHHHESQEIIKTGNIIKSNSEFSLSQGGEINLENVDKAVHELQTAVKDIVASGGKGSFEVKLHSSGADEKCTGGICNLHESGHMQKEIIKNKEILSGGQHHIAISPEASINAHHSSNVEKEILHAESGINHKENLESNLNLSGEKHFISNSHSGGGGLNLGGAGSITHSHASHLETGNLNLGGHAGQLGAGLNHNVGIGSILKPGSGVSEHKIHGAGSHTSISDVTISSGATGHLSHKTDELKHVGPQKFPNKGINVDIAHQQKGHSIHNQEGHTGFPNFGGVGAGNGIGVAHPGYVNGYHGGAFGGYGSGGFGFGSNPGIYGGHHGRRGFHFGRHHHGQIHHGGFGGFPIHPGYQIGFTGFGAGNFPIEGFGGGVGGGAGYENPYGFYGGQNGAHITSGLSLENGRPQSLGGIESAGGAISQEIENTGTHGTPINHNSGNIGLHATSNSETHISDTVTHSKPMVLNVLESAGGVPIGHSSGNIALHGTSVSESHDVSNAATHSGQYANVGLEGTGVNGAGLGDIQSSVVSGEAFGQHNTGVGGGDIDIVEEDGTGKKVIKHHEHHGTHKTIHKDGKVIHKNSGYTITHTTTKGVGPGVVSSHEINDVAHAIDSGLVAGAHVDGSILANNANKEIYTGGVESHGIKTDTNHEIGVILSSGLNVGAGISGLNVAAAGNVHGGSNIDNSHEIKTHAIDTDAIDVEHIRSDISTNKEIYTSGGSVKSHEINSHKDHEVGGILSSGLHAGAGISGVNVAEGEIHKSDLAHSVSHLSTDKVNKVELGGVLETEAGVNIAGTSNGLAAHNINAGASHGIGGGVSAGVDKVPGDYNHYTHSAGGGGFGANAFGAYGGLGLNHGGVGFGGYGAVPNHNVGTAFGGGFGGYGAVPNHNFGASFSGGFGGYGGVKGYGNSGSSKEQEVINLAGGKGYGGSYGK